MGRLPPGSKPPLWRNPITGMMATRPIQGTAVETIPLLQLGIALLPALAVIGIQLAWAQPTGQSWYALARMLAQLLLVGYALTYIFAADHPGPVLAVLAVMIAASCWIALGNVPGVRRQLLAPGLGAIAIAGFGVLALVAGPVLRIEPWYQPSILIPLAGMIFSAAMNSVSLAGERLYAELERADDYLVARDAAFRAALIPVLNSFFAVGLVTLPGMMTGQILSGVSPLVAARYQIVVMAMVLGASGIAAALFLHWIRDRAVRPQGRESARGDL